MKYAQCYKVAQLRMIVSKQFRKLYVLVLPAGAAVPIRDWVCLYPVLGLLSCPPSSMKI